MSQDSISRISPPKVAFGDTKNKLTMNVNDKILEPIERREEFRI